MEDDVSSDEEISPKSANQIAEEGKDDSISEEDYHRMLRKHHQKRLLKRVRKERERGREGRKGKRKGGKEIGRSERVIKGG